MKMKINFHKRLIVSDFIAIFDFKKNLLPCHYYLVFNLIWSCPLMSATFWFLFTGITSAVNIRLRLKNKKAFVWSTTCAILDNVNSGLYEVRENNYGRQKKSALKTSK